MRDWGGEDWTNLTDRDGLWHISDQTYSFFYAKEAEVSSHFQSNQASTIKEGSRQIILEHIRAIKILFQWCMLCSDSSDAASKELYNFANRQCTRHYEERKGIRKELFA